MQAERDRVKSDEFVTKATAEKTSRDRSLVRLEDENAGLRQQLHTMQSQLAQVEHDHAQRSERTHSAYQRRSVRRSVVNRGQSGQAIKLFQAPRKISFTLQFRHRSFILYS